MNLLILTQKVDKGDDNLGFFYEWVKKFAEKAEQVFVIANFAGEYSLPANVRVVSLGKERKLSRIRRYFNFYKYLFEVLPQADAVFVHMIPVWVILAWPIAFFFSKKTYLWYAHKSVTLSLRFADKLASRAFASSKDGYRLNSKKLVITGQGVDTEHFKPKEFAKSGGSLRLLAVGRVAQAKGYEFLLDVIHQLKKQSGGDNFIFDIVGVAITNEDFFYEKQLEKFMEEKNLRSNVRFLGAKTYAEMPDIYNSHDVLLHASETGSLDKVVLEAMACGLPVITTSEAFGDMLEALPKDVNVMADKITGIAIGNKNLSLRNLIIKEHNLDNLIQNIIKLIGN